MFIFFVLAVLIIILIDGVPLIKNKQWTQLTVFLIIIAVSCLLMLCNTAGLPLPLKSLNDVLGGFGKKLFG